eukprot:3310914-Amphidinium_carterae.1
MSHQPGTAAVQLAALWTKVQEFYAETKAQDRLQQCTTNILRGIVDAYPTSQSDSTAVGSQATRAALAQAHPGYPWARMRLEDCRNFHDPGGRQLRGHSGLHSSIQLRMSANRRWDNLLEFLVTHVMEEYWQ